MGWGDAAAAARRKRYARANFHKIKKLSVEERRQLESAKCALVERLAAREEEERSASLREGVAVARAAMRGSGFVKLTRGTLRLQLLGFEGGEEGGRVRILPEGGQEGVVSVLRLERWTAADAAVHESTQAKLAMRMERKRVAAAERERARAAAAQKEKERKQVGCCCCPNTQVPDAPL